MIAAPEPLLGTVPNANRESPSRADSRVAVFVAVACLVFFVWAWNTMFYCELEWPPIVPMSVVDWAKALPGRYLSLFGASLFCALVGLIFGIYARRTTAGRFVIVTVTVPFALLGGMVAIVKMSEARWNRNHSQHHLKSRAGSVASLDAAKRAGMEGAASPHWLRHAQFDTPATRSTEFDQGASLARVNALATLSDNLGHASMATTGRYTHARLLASRGKYLAV